MHYKARLCLPAKHNVREHATAQKERMHPKKKTTKPRRRGTKKRRNKKSAEREREREINARIVTKQLCVPIPGKKSA